MVAAQNQAPPPYYPATGLENKALEHSMDLALSMEDPKNAVYATQNGYGYHVAPNVQGHPGQNINGGECKSHFSNMRIKYFRQGKRGIDSSVNHV